MSKRIGGLSFVKRVVAGAALTLAGLAAGAAEPAAVAIFNGRDLTGWTAENAERFWRVADGVLVGENDAAQTGSVLRTAESYGDFVLEFEVRWSGEIDSGVMLRAPELQLQLGVSRSLKRDLTGAFYVGGSVRYPEAGLPRGVEQLFRPGEWNAFRLEARGTEFVVSLNGREISRYADAKYSGTAPIGLQVHPKLAMKVEFRNLRVMLPGR